ncbi:hypothetical protein QSJ19_00890 [Gordonia sp. ABSL11-1]|uniref:hypothetical protein n=1 Tax=Gordonia sp. ABSL11-1 TaxID=3053924 RepID=UPI002572671A|nr:hypothetical protein [Gordonia sp. ABSL11-1]MDL9944157.1 hypothetical protein [Gordonia sp. ABSL11-1]
MKKLALVILSVIAALFLGGCGSDTNDDVATSSSSAAPEITSWQTWAQHFRSQMQQCQKLMGDECFVQNSATIASMRMSILDNDLEIDGAHSGIVNPMQNYQDAYADFTKDACQGGSQSLEMANLTCNVKRDQMITFSDQVRSGLDVLAAGGTL